MGNSVTLLRSEAQFIRFWIVIWAVKCDASPSNGGCMAIGERIRDKVAASRKRGIWMGGYVPLGYRR